MGVTDHMHFHLGETPTTHGRYEITLACLPRQRWSRGLISKRTRLLEHITCKRCLMVLDGLLQKGYVKVRPKGADWVGDKYVWGPVVEFVGQPDPRPPTPVMLAEGRVRKLLYGPAVRAKLCQSIIEEWK